MAKAELKTRATRASADGFIRKIADSQTRKDCQTIAAMMKEVTKAPAVMWGPSIVGFGNWSYTYDSGRTGDWFLMGFSPRKQNLTLYITPCFEIFEKGMPKLGKYKTGKCCLYIKRLNDIDTAVLKRLMKDAMKQMKTIQAAPTAQAGLRELEKKRAAKKKKISKKA